jgi:hypothetical protein
MNKLTKESFLRKWTDSVNPAFFVQLEGMFARIYDRSGEIPFVVREFVDATAAAQSRYLPPIATNSSRDYQYIKIDASANAVTIYPAGTDTIEGATSLTLAAQYDWVILYPNAGVWYRNP